jgi:hypothetical protein
MIFKGECRQPRPIYRRGYVDKRGLADLVGTKSRQSWGANSRILQGLSMSLPLPAPLPFVGRGYGRPPRAIGRVCSTSFAIVTRVSDRCGLQPHLIP